ncbi:MAG: hypothetical protein Q9184_007115 [Pyrenodesmia sp. 2 TL-2023]
MSTFGPHLYQSDLELRTLTLLAHTASPLFSDPTCLCSPLLPSHLTLRAPISPTTVIQELEFGILNRLLHHFKHKGDDLAVILLGCVAMELGVGFGREDMLVLKMCVMRGGKKGGRDVMGEGVRDGVAVLGEGRRWEEVLQAVEGYANLGGGVGGWVFKRGDEGKEEKKRSKGERAKQNYKSKESAELEEMETTINKIEREVKGERGGAIPDGSNPPAAATHHKPKLKHQAVSSPHHTNHTKPDIKHRHPNTNPKPPPQPLKSSLKPTSSHPPSNPPNPHRASWFPIGEQHTTTSSSNLSVAKESPFLLPNLQQQQKADVPLVGAESCYRLSLLGVNGGKMGRGERERGERREKGVKWKGMEGDRRG